MPVTLGNIAFQALSLAVLGIYCWMIYEFRPQAAECLKNIVIIPRTEGAATGNKQMYDRFLGVAMTLGALSAGVGAAKVAAAALAAGTGTPGTIQWKIAGFMGTGGLSGMPLWVAPATVGVVALFTVCVVLIEAGVLKIAGRITFSEKFVGEVIRTKKNSLAALSMLTAPLVAVWTGVNPTRDRWIVYLFITMIVVAAILFIVHTLRGFIKQKVSLLVWFLYLCTVEIFPVYAATLAVIKNV